MAKIELSLPFEKFVQRQLEGGRFDSATEVVEAALGLLEAHEAAHAGALAEITGKIQESLDDPRPSIPAEEVFARLDAKQARRMSGGDGS